MNNKYNKILRKVGIAGMMIFAVAGVWFFAGAHGAASSALLRTAKEVANILSVIIINLVVVFVALDKASGFAILDTQSKLLTPPALTLL